MIHTRDIDLIKIYARSQHLILCDDKIIQDKSSEIMNRDRVSFGLSHRIMHDMVTGSYSRYLSCYY